ncbi:Glycosyl transferase family protein [candidate division SR1 bacterium RAAC1_SR1_1]|nr:Glycosyl transferase family protein [candidate division SR1 bacterium RAAC1_SR1_1]
MKKTCTCIIPFYNEEIGILGVLEKLIQIDLFDKIVVVNDGSHDSSPSVVETFIKNNKDKDISLVSYNKNKGKSHAVAEGLKTVTTEYVFLFDADLTNIKINEVTSLIESLYNNPEIDMGILRRIHAKRYIKLLYRELILSGQRMLRADDLRTIFKEKFERYQLEVAINTYMQNHKKIVVRYPFSGNNSFKPEKWGFWNGWKRDFFMYKDILGYQGTVNFLKHVFLFNPYNIEKYSKTKKYSKK